MYFSVFQVISGYIEFHLFFLEVVSKILTTNHYPSLSWCFTWNTKLCLGTPEISGDTRYPMIFKTEWGWVDFEKIPASGSSLGTCWALQISTESLYWVKDDFRTLLSQERWEIGLGRQELVKTNKWIILPLVWKQITTIPCCWGKDDLWTQNGGR